MPKADSGLDGYDPVAIIMLMALENVIDADYCMQMAETSVREGNYKAAKLWSHVFHNEVDSTLSQIGCVFKENPDLLKAVSDLFSGSGVIQLTKKAAELTGL